MVEVGSQGQEELTQEWGKVEDCTPSQSRGCVYFLSSFRLVESILRSGLFVPKT